MKFNETKDSVAERTIKTNYEGGEAFKPDSAEMSLYKVTINNLLEDTFYTEDEEQLEKVTKRFDAVADDNPEFALKLAAYARNEMGLRDVSQLLLVLAANDERTKEYVRNYADRIMVRTDEPCTVVAIHDQLFGGTIPKPLKKGINDALHQWDRYQFDKYDNDNREVNIRDVINRTHPKPRDELREEIFERLMKGDLDNHPDVEPLNESQGATWETTISEKGNNREAWMEVKDRMGIMAKLRNIRNMKEAGLEGKEILTDEDFEAVEDSRMFPFRLYQSYKAVKNARVSDPHIDEWIEEAIDKTIGNLPDKLGSTFVGVDVSGSMKTSVSNKSNLECKEIACLFGATAMKKSARTGVFASDFVEVEAHSQTPALEIQDKMRKARVGSSTNGWKVIEHLIQNEIEVDRIVFMTDMQIWDSDSWRSKNNRTVKKAFEDYREKVNPEANLYMLDLQSYGDLATPEGYEGVYNISGWNSKIIEFIEYAEKPREIIDEVECYE